MPKIVYGTKEFEDTHTWNLLGIDTDVRFVLSYQEWFPYPELTLLRMKPITADSLALFAISRCMSIASLRQQRLELFPIELFLCHQRLRKFGELIRMLTQQITSHFVPLMKDSLNLAINQ